jgi:hypothetical protein
MSRFWKLGIHGPDSFKDTVRSFSFYPDEHTAAGTA